MTILYRRLEDDYKFLEVEGKDEMLALLKGWKPVLEDAWACLWYAEYIGGRWKPGEAVIATDPGTASWYAEYVLKGRWEPGEAAIATDHHAAFYYAKDVIKGRWEPGEAAIATDRYTAYHYAKLLKGTG